ncbi:ras guanine nucleotide exchange factor domain-containing protein [Lanmaoa asiatica]|nr:ras guanine nucleotide exchange factor domain-containing protein [Lanmaoa asiatica]
MEDLLLELFSLLVQRFYIQPPDSLTPTESEEWKRLEQHVVQSRVLDIFETMLMDDGVIENDNMYIFDRIKEFLRQEAVSTFATSRRVLVWIDRAQRGELGLRAPSNPVSPPESIVLVTDGQLNLLDIDPLELARQLTILESQVIQLGDSIAWIIQVTNGVANWVADTVLSQNDPGARAVFLRQFILVADNCRSVQNYSTMVAIISGLKSPAIRQLKRSWEQVDKRHLTQLNACETIIDSGNNSTKYHSTLASTVPPCVPFMGVLLTTLASIRDGSEDTLPGNLVNFRRRQEVSKVIQDIQRWKALPHHFHSLPVVQAYLEESPGRFTDQAEISDALWILSLGREPRESEDAWIARLLKEDGFL